MADLNVRGIPDDVLVRLKEQASLDGISLSEWVRITLADRAARPTASELTARRVELADSAQPRDEFDRYYHDRLHRRSA